MVPHAIFSLPNLGPTSVLGRHHRGQQRDQHHRRHGHVFLVKASANGRAGNIIIMLIRNVVRSQSWPLSVPEVGRHLSVDGLVVLNHIRCPYRSSLGQALSTPMTFSSWNQGTPLSFGEDGYVWPLSRLLSAFHALHEQILIIVVVIVTTTNTIIIISVFFLPIPPFSLYSQRFFIFSLSFYCNLFFVLSLLTSVLRIVWRWACRCTMIKVLTSKNRIWQQWRKCGWSLWHLMK